MCGHTTTVAGDFNTAGIILRPPIFGSSGKMGSIFGKMGSSNWKMGSSKS